MSAFLKNFLNFLNGFRKLFICVIVLLLATTFVITGHLTGGEYAQVLTITVPAYFAGNVGEHLTETVKDWLIKKVKKGK